MSQIKKSIVEKEVKSILNKFQVSIKKEPGKMIGSILVKTKEHLTSEVLQALLKVANEIQSKLEVYRSGVGLSIKFSL